MFEMLGNFSLGSYYKEEAISLANRFLINEIGMNRDHLRISVHSKDPEARDLWKSVFIDCCFHSRSVAFGMTRSYQEVIKITHGVWDLMNPQVDIVLKSSILYKSSCGMMRRLILHRHMLIGWKSGIWFL